MRPFRGDQPRVNRILASAGSGKTFALTSRYLALVHAGVDPSRILATTFSRAAAAEIRSRVLRRSALAVLSEDKRRELAGACGIDVGAFDEAAAARLLQRVVDGIPRSRIRTLDSFFAGIVSAFASELGLAGVPRVLDEGEEHIVLLEAIRLAMDEEDETSLLRTILSLARGRRVAAVLRTAEDALKDLLGVFGETEPAAWDWPVFDGPPTERLLAIRDALRVASVSELPHKSMPSALLKDADLVDRVLRSGDEVWDPGVLGSLLNRAMVGDEILFHGKSPPAAATSAYQELGPIALRGFRSNYARMTASMRALAAAISSRRTRHTRAQGLAGFSDLTALLDPRAQHQPDLDEVWFRLDGRIQHLLLDEFQDTNVVQWRALQRLIEEIVASADDDRSLFVVGDLKQAIYGWRGGEPRLLGELSDVLGELLPGTAVESGDLRVSYRSSRAVIDFANLVFGRLGAYVSEDGVEQDAVRGWAKRFATHDTVRKDIEGAVEVIAVPFGEGRSPDRRAHIRAIRTRVRETRQRRPGASIGVILRENKTVAGVARALQRDGLAVRVVGNGALLDREAPLCVLQALRLAEWPGDTIAAFDLATSPLAPLVGLNGVWDGAAFGGGDRGRGAAASASRELRRAFETDGIAATIDGWRHRLREQLDDHENLRLRQMVTVVDRLERSVDRSPGEIAALVMKARVEHATGGEIAVMNVHQSKGLEFDVVIVADIEGKLVGNSSKRTLAWSSPRRPTDPIPRIVRWIPAALHEPLVDMAALCDETSGRQIEESLSILYVALTRARDELTVVVSDVKTVKKGNVADCSKGTLAAVVRDAVSESSLAVAAGEPCESVHLRGSPPRESMEVAPPIAEDRIGAPLAFAVDARESARRRGRPASEHQTRLDLFRRRDRDRLDRGTAFHAALACIGWLPEDEPSPTRVRSALRAALPHRSSTWIEDCRSEIARALARPTLRALLSRPDARCRARNEYAFVQTGPGGVVQGSIDRLVLRESAGGIVTAAEVIDYKTDDLPIDGMQTLVDRHTPQLVAYRDVVMGQFALDPSAVRMLLFSLQHDRLVEIPSP